MEMRLCHDGRFVTPNTGFRRGQPAKVVTRKKGMVTVQFDSDRARADYKPHELDDRES